MPNNNLGRGLSSLIPKKVNQDATTSSSEPAAGAVSADDKDRILQVAPDQIKTNPMQPRSNFSQNSIEELAGSIKQYGIIQPLVVSPSLDGKFELITGERRLRAAKVAGLDKVPVIVRDAQEQEKLEMALIENIQRTDLNPVELAIAYQKLINEFNLNHEELAKRIGKARSSITNTLRILDLPDEIKQGLKEGKINKGHSKLIAGLDSEEKQLALFKKIVLNSLSVHSAIKEVRHMGGTKAARIKINYADKDKEFALREFFKTKIEIKRKGKGGQIIIDFFSDEELAEIINKVK